ncbi:MAG: helix-turn-helix transcriptional regulator [Bryobacterales bacterium]|nr:helix-turn-helix transcriptional regulator [Bryobacterales bacterium]
MADDTTQAIPAEYSEWTAGYLASQTEKYDRFGVGRLYIDITGHLTDGIIFSRLMYWFAPSTKGKPRTKVSRDGYRWVARNYDQWWEECRVDERTARASVKRMVDSGLLIKAVYKFGKKPTTHLRINWQTFEKLAKEHLSISLEDKRTLKRSKRQKMSERNKTVPAKNDEIIETSKNVRTIVPAKNDETYSMITGSLNTTLNTSLQPAAGASVAGAPEVAAKAVAPEAKRESAEAVKDEGLTERKQLPPMRLTGTFNPPMLQLAMDVRGIDVAALADKANIHPIKLAEILAWKAKPTDEQIATLAKRLGFPPEFFNREFVPAKEGETFGPCPPPKWEQPAEPKAAAAKKPKAPPAPRKAQPYDVLFDAIGEHVFGAKDAAGRAAVAGRIAPILHGDKKNGRCIGIIGYECMRQNRETNELDYNALADDVGVFWSWFKANNRDITIADCAKVLDYWQKWRNATKGQNNKWTYDPMTGKWSEPNAK